MNNIDNMNMSNININNNSDDDEDEGYKRFLAFLASSPNHEEKAAAVAPPSMPMLIISGSEDHEISSSTHASDWSAAEKDPHSILPVCSSLVLLEHVTMINHRGCASMCIGV